MNAQQGRQLHVVDPYPAPASWEEAERFLRQKCKVVQEWGEDSDFYKVTCQADNMDGDKGKLYQELEIPHSATVGQRQRLLHDMANRMHEWWKMQTDGVE